MRHTTSLIGGLAPRENHLGKPADFLIGPDGTIRACKYGVHADDQWSVDEVPSSAEQTQKLPHARRVGSFCVCSPS